jgi:hypothetical protein
MERLAFGKGSSLIEREGNGKVEFFWVGRRDFGRRVKGGRERRRRREKTRMKNLGIDEGCMREMNASNCRRVDKGGHWAEL